MPTITKDYYHNIDLLANQLLNSRLHNITTAARIILGNSLTSQSKGYQVYDTDLSAAFYWDGSAWNSASAVWGSITGTLSSQTDLQTALNAKFNDPTGTTSQYIRGDGSLATFPSIPTVTPAALTKTNDTNVTLTLGGSPNTALLQAVSLTLGWTGTLADNRIASASTWNSKEPGITAGTTSQYWRGDKTWQTFPTIPTVGTWGALNYPTWTSGTPFVKMTAAGTFSLDTTTYEPTLTKGNLTETTSSVLTITGGTGSVIGSGTTIRVKQASGSQAGYLSSTDWSTFNGKQNALSGSGIVKSTSGTISYISGTNTQFVKADGSLDSNTYLTNAVTSVGLSMPSAFTVSNSPVTSTGTLAVAAAGVASQYIRGDGTLASFPTSGGGGSSVNYYLNGSVSQGTIGGNTYYQMSRTPVTTTPGTDFTINTNGIIARFITDANDPGLLAIPGGNWNLEFYFSSSSAGGSPSFYANIYKYNGSTFTLLGSNSIAPEGITNGTTIDSYFTSVSIPTGTLTLIDRIAIEIYVNNSGRTITFHTEDNHIAEIITTFTVGLSALNGLTSQVQYFSTGTSGSDFNISSASQTHTFNIPVASDTNTGKLSNTDYTTFTNKASKGFAVAMAAAL